MCKILIFGGTTEGRLLSEYCERNGMAADVSVATDYGAKMLSDKGSVRILTGRLDVSHMQELISSEKYSLVIDATHPYASEVTANIKKACESTETQYFRLIRKSGPVTYGTRTYSMDEMINILNEETGVILSTLGTKELDALMKVKDCFRRVWVRALPSAEFENICIKKGFDPDKVIAEQGPFSEEQNINHILKSGAEIMITKESGTAGGFDEKAAAAQKCGIKLVTLARPVETGFLYEEIIRILEDRI